MSNKAQHLLVTILAITGISYSSYSISVNDQVLHQGRVSGLNGEITLTADWGESLKIRANGAYRFSQPQPVGNTYQLKICHLCDIQ